MAILDISNDPIGRSQTLLLLEFVEKLAALIPPARVHLTRFFGCLAPHAKIRAQIVPQPLPVPVRPADAADPQKDAPERPARRKRWAELLARVFGLDMQKCVDCGGPLKIVSAILLTTSGQTARPRTGKNSRTIPVQLDTVAARGGHRAPPRANNFLKVPFHRNFCHRTRLWGDFSSQIALDTGKNYQFLCKISSRNGLYFSYSPKRLWSWLCDSEKLVAAQKCCP